MSRSMRWRATRREFIAAVAGGAALAVLPGIDPNLYKPVELRTLCVSGKGRVSQAVEITHSNTVYEDVAVGMRFDPEEAGIYRVYLQTQVGQPVEEMEQVAEAPVTGGELHYAQFMIKSPPRQWGLHTEFEKA